MCVCEYTKVGVGSDMYLYSLYTSQKHRASAQILHTKSGVPVSKGASFSNSFIQRNVHFPDSYRLAWTEVGDWSKCFMDQRSQNIVARAATSALPRNMLEI